MFAMDVMTRFVWTVASDAPLRTALALMVERQVSGLPVVDAGGRLVGILTEGDLLHRVETGTNEKLRSKWIEFLVGPGRSAEQYVTEHSRRVEDLMTRDVATVTEGTPLAEVVTVMEHRRIRRVPVVRSERLVGIIGRRDLLRVLAQRLAALPAGSATDAQIQASIMAELKPQPWVVASNIHIAVKNGVVTLGGLIYDERCRDGLRVAAENVPGVQRIQDELVWVDPQGSGFTSAA